MAVVRSTLTRSITTVVLLFCTATCFSPDLGDQPFKCAAAAPACPPGYDCVATFCLAQQSGLDAGGGGDGARVCEPNQVICDNDTAMVCNDDGTKLTSTPCGTDICFPSVGCMSVCGGAGLGRTEGCEFFATAAANGQALSGFGVSIMNAGQSPAYVRIDGGGLLLARYVTVPPRSSVTEKLPWVDALSSCRNIGCTFTGQSGVQSRAAFRLLTTLPVSVVQWSPIGPAAGGDASRLLPTRTMGRDYMTASPPIPPSPTGTPAMSFVAVTGTAASTSVTVRPSIPTVAATGFPSIPAHGTKTVSLARHDVLLLYAVGDLTGSTVTADASVQVLAGGVCQGSPCTHAEEVMLPRGALTKSLVMPALPGVTTNVRVVATDAPTTVTVSDGVQTTVPVLLAAAGDYEDYVLGTNFLGSIRLTAEGGNVLVTQSAGTAMTIYRPPVDKVTLVHVPSWTTRVLTVTAKSGDSLRIDGVLQTAMGANIAESGQVRFLIDIPAGAHIIETTNDSVVGNLGNDSSVASSLFWY